MASGWEVVEDRLAEWFGLDQSKYQWAVDELLERQLVSRSTLRVSVSDVLKLHISNPNPNHAVKHCSVFFSLV
jgi:hypothetical protein